LNAGGCARIIAARVGRQRCFKDERSASIRKAATMATTGCNSLARAPAASDWRALLRHWRAALTHRIESARVIPPRHRLGSFDLARSALAREIVRR
jgi:hypothetical protein